LDFVVERTERKKDHERLDYPGNMPYLVLSRRRDGAARRKADETMAKRASKKTATIYEAVAFGVAHGIASDDADLKIANACYFATFHFPSLVSELNKLGDAHSRAHALRVGILAA
jgi:hypothetical protein